jgi:hypothetical protein
LGDRRDGGRFQGKDGHQPRRPAKRQTRRKIRKILSPIKMKNRCDSDYTLEISPRRTRVRWLIQACGQAAAFAAKESADAAKKSKSGK